MAAAVALGMIVGHQGLPPRRAPDVLASDLRRWVRSGLEDRAARRTERG